MALRLHDLAGADPDLRFSLYCWPLWRLASHLAMTVGVAVGFAAGLAPLAASSAEARDLVVYAEPTLKPVLRTIGQLWRAKSGVRVNVFVARSELSFGQIERGARCDVIVALAGDSMEDAQSDKLVKPGTTTPVFRNSLVLVGREGRTGGDIASVVAGRKLAIADPERDVAGSFGLAALEKAGVKIDPESAAVAVAESSGGVMRLLGDRQAELGIVYATDAAGRTALKLVLPLPAASHPAIEYVAAEAVNAQSDTREFLAFLKSDEARRAITAAGLQPSGN
jgi:molybdate transport system substrate-binding protein